MLGILPATMYLLSMLGVGNQARQMHLELSKTKTKERVEMGTGREDPPDGVISSGMVFTQLKENAALLVIAGSETTATLLTGAIFLLLLKVMCFGNWHLRYGVVLKTRLISHSLALMASLI